MKGWLFTNVLTYGGAFLALLWPFYGLLIYICFAIIKPEAMWHWSVPAGNYSRIVAIAMLIGWGLRGFGNWNFGRASLTVYSLLGFFGWAAICSTMASHGDAAWDYLDSLSKIILPFIVGITLIETRQQFNQVAWVLIGCLGYLALVLNLDYWSGYNRLVAEGYASMDNNTLSIAMICGAALAFFYGLYQSNFWLRWLCYFAAGLMSHVPMFGESRGAMLALVVVGIVSFLSFLLLPNQAKNYWVFGLAVFVGGFLLAGQSVYDRFSTVFADEKDRDASAESRFVLWGQCRDMMLSNPLFGVGPANFPEQVAPLWGGKKKHAHSLWAQTGAETGLPGVLLLMTFYGSVIWRLWKVARSKEHVDMWVRESARMIVVALIGFGVAASFVTVTGVEPPYYAALLGAGLLKMLPQPSRSPATQSRRLDSSSEKSRWSPAPVVR